MLTDDPKVRHLLTRAAEARWQIASVRVAILTAPRLPSHRVDDWAFAEQLGDQAEAQLKIAERWRQLRQLEDRYATLCRALGDAVVAAYDIQGPPEAGAAPPNEEHP